MQTNNFEKLIYSPSNLVPVLKWGFYHSVAEWILLELCVWTWDIKDNLPNILDEVHKPHKYSLTHPNIFYVICVTLDVRHKYVKSIEFPIDRYEDETKII